MVYAERQSVAVIIVIFFRVFLHTVYYLVVCSFVVHLCGIVVRARVNNINGIRS